LAAIAAIAASLPAYAQVAISAQDAGTSSASNIVTMQRVPVQNGANPVQYFDVTITLAPTFTGSKVSGITASATSAPSAILQTRHFVAGTYIDQSGNSYTVSGPGVGIGGGTVWSISEKSGGTDCLAQATWYTATGNSNPENGRVQAAKITSTLYSYGVEGTAQGACNDYKATFGTDTLIGAYQSGNSLVISSFTLYYDGDWQNPLDEITLTLQ